MQKDREKLDELGCTFMTYDCHWSNEEWQFFAVEEWPSLESIEKNSKFKEEELSITFLEKQATNEFLRKAVENDREDS